MLFPIKRNTHHSLSHPLIILFIITILVDTNASIINSIFIIGYYSLTFNNSQTLLSNELIKRISISIIINQSILLEQVNTFTLLNALHVICIPCSVSDGMSSSNSIINHHYPISLCLSTRNCSHLLWVKKEKEDLINQSLLSFILFIINSFDSITW